MASVRSFAEAPPRQGSGGSTLRALSIIAAAGMLVLIGLAAASPAGAAADADEVRQHAESIVSGKRYQTDMPEGRPPPKPPERSSSDFSLGKTAQYILYGLLAVFVVFILYTLLSQRIAPARKGARRQARARETAAAKNRLPSAAELADAEAAALAEAKAGRFEEAIHVLLLGAIGRLREKDARATARSLTSREILARVFLGPEEGEARSALRALVAAVEISRFGGRPADSAAFERCLEAYRALRRVVDSARAGGVPRVGPDMKTA